MYCASALAFIAGPACADAWPRLASIDGAAPCEDALRLATAAFVSDAFYLYDPAVIPAAFQPHVLARADALDISGGDALKVDAETFAKLPRGADGTARSIYWQQTPQGAYRIALQETAVGWRGDMYALFAVDAKLTSDEFRNAVREADTSDKIREIISAAWRPPLVFRNGPGRQVWFIDVGQPYEFLGSWQVYVARADTIRSGCTIQFRPDVEQAARLLPEPVRKLATLLDSTIGPGNGEGTLQPTARLRNQIEHTLANAAMRPWALEQPLNTRADVVRGLEAWSRQGRSFRKRHRDIWRSYPDAEESLAAYYKTHFNKSATDAARLATYVLDLVLRSHYVFPRDGDAAPRTIGRERNPWQGNSQAGG